MNKKGITKINKAMECIAIAMDEDNNDSENIVLNRIYNRLDKIVEMYN